MQSRKYILLLTCYWEVLSTNQLFFGLRSQTEQVVIIIIIIVISSSIVNVLKTVNTQTTFPLNQK